MKNMILIMIAIIGFCLISCDKDDVVDSSDDKRLENTVNIEDLCPDSHHPHIIDMGNAGKWSCCNVGASAPWEYGGYYAWGETKEKQHYDYNNYIHSEGIQDTYHDLGKDIAGTEYDVAYVRWGGDWRMPSLLQLYHLCECTGETAILNGVRGAKFTSTNGNSIFLPTAGGGEYKPSVSVFNGFYWSSTVSSNNIELANGLKLFYTNQGLSSYTSASYRIRGYPVRPVIGK